MVKTENLRGGRAEGPAQGRDADIDDGVVHHAHEFGQAEHRQGNEPAPGPGRRRGPGGGARS